MTDINSILIPARQMKDRFASLLADLNFTKERGDAIAEIFTNNSVDGIYTHGVNRFPAFINHIKSGLVKPDATPSHVINLVQ